MSTFILFILHIFTLLSTSVTGKVKDARFAEKHVFSATKEGFELDGKKFNVYAGEIHYFRIAACAWEDRLRKLQRAGLNTVSTAVEWAMHHPTQKTCNWSGDANFTRFVELAQNLNLYVIVRAGPYIGVDRNLGGIPEWILTEPKPKHHPWIERSSPEYRHYSEVWLSFFLPKLKKMMVTNGGPVIMVQIDSDLGEISPCDSKDWLHNIYKAHLGKNAVFFTMDNNKERNIKCGKIDGTISAIRTDPYEYINSFSKSAVTLFSEVKNDSTPSPKLVELRTGVAWNWRGQRLLIGNINFISTLKDLIYYDASIIIYMFAGGTNFERAGKDKNDFMGMITSYDFDAIVSESGDITGKFNNLKRVLSASDFSPDYEALFEEKESISGSYDIYETLNFSYLGSLLDEEVRNDFGILGIESQYPLPFNKLNVSNGLVLYKTTIPENFTSKRSVFLYCEGVRDRGYVYINNNLIGIMDNIKHFSLKIDPLPGRIIQILVENHGYSAENSIGEPKGIISDVTLNNQILTKWIMYVLSLDNVERLQAAAKNMKSKKPLKEGNSIFLAAFQTPENMYHTSDHTYLNMFEKSFKGQAFLNGRSLGKYWRIGPQTDLYVPRCYLNPYPMENRLLVISMQQKKMYFDEDANTISNRMRSGSKSSIHGRGNLLLSIILFYFCWFWRSGYAFSCS